jgi:hypothetical protein
VPHLLRLNAIDREALSHDRPSASALHSRPCEGVDSCESEARRFEPFGQMPTPRLSKLSIRRGCRMNSKLCPNDCFRGGARQNYASAWRTTYRRDGGRWFSDCDARGAIRCQSRCVLRRSRRGAADRRQFAMGDPILCATISCRLCGKSGCADSSAALGALESRMTHISGFERSQLLLLPEAVDDYCRRR